MDFNRLLVLVQTSLLVLLAAGHGLFWLPPRPLIEPLARAVGFVRSVRSINRLASTGAGMVAHSRTTGRGRDGRPVLFLRGKSHRPRR